MPGLKLGLYTLLGRGSCAYPKYPYAGSDVGLGCGYDELRKGCPRAKQDIADFVSWGVDHLKIDGCGRFDSVRMNESYALVGRYLASHGRPVVYHPSNLGLRYPRQFGELAAIANQWRFFHDISDDWASVKSIIEGIGAGQPECNPDPLPPACYNLVLSLIHI